MAAFYNREASINQLFTYSYHNWACARSTRSHPDTPSSLFPNRLQTILRWPRAGRALPVHPAQSESGPAAFRPPIPRAAGTHAVYSLTGYS